MTVAVTGGVVNLRTGPGTDHPVATGELVWVYGPLTEIRTGEVPLLAIVETVGIEVAAPTETAPKPVPTPITPTVPVGCTRLHTVNPNETQLAQITDWFGLDLVATAELNGLAPDTPLTAGWQLCLPEAGEVQS